MWNSVVREGLQSVPGTQLGSDVVMAIVKAAGTQGQERWHGVCVARVRRGWLSSVAGQRHTDATNLVFLASHLRKNARTKCGSRTTGENHEWSNILQTSSSA